MRSTTIVLIVLAFANVSYFGYRNASEVIPFVFRLIGIPPDNFDAIGIFGCLLLTVPLLILYLIAFGYRIHALSKQIDSMSSVEAEDHLITK